MAKKKLGDMVWKVLVGCIIAAVTNYLFWYLFASMGMTWKILPRLGIDDIVNLLLYMLIAYRGVDKGDDDMASIGAGGLAYQIGCEIIEHLGYYISPVAWLLLFL